jgi:hypothetical protein
MSLSTQGLLIQHTDAVDDFKAYNRNLYSKVFQQVGWEAKDNEGTLLLIQSLKQSLYHSFVSFTSVKHH